MAEEREKIYIATPAGVLIDELSEVTELDNCIIVNGCENIIVTDKDGKVFVKTTKPMLEDINVDEEDGETCVVVRMSNMLQHGDTNTIRVFDNPEQAETFSRNAKAMVQLAKVCQNYLNNKNKE